MRYFTQQLLVILILLFPPLKSALADSLVADAAMMDDVGRVTELLRQGEDVNSAQGDGMQFTGRRRTATESSQICWFLPGPT